MLVGTRSIEKSERLSAFSRRSGIEHQILNAKNHEIEAQIVAQAGQKGRVTVATNMAGRGTDIKLGEGVAELGGLHVIGTERHEARRIDRQLSGRCARQGDPGCAQFFVCLDDEIIEAFGEKSAARIRKRLGGRGELTSLRMRRFFVAAQRKKERQHFRDRKLLMHYEKQRAEMRKNMGLNPVLGLRRLTAGNRSKLRASRPRLKCRSISCSRSLSEPRCFSAYRDAVGGRLFAR